MLLRIESVTAYDYDAPPRRGTQYLRLTPRSMLDQIVVDWTIRAPGSLAAWTDMFGNRCHTLTLKHPPQRLEISVAGLVETKDTAGILATDPKTALPVNAYLRKSDYALPDDALMDLASGHRGRVTGDRLSGLHDLMSAIHRDVAYDESATTVLTTAAEALSRRRGVCQDHAHIMIAAARILEVPTRYVSGYLWTGWNGKASSASHAWCECWVERLGWVSFDPANGVSASEPYVRVATGFDYATAGPLRGIRVGGGTETLTVKVRLFREEQAAQQQ